MLKRHVQYGYVAYIGHIGNIGHVRHIRLDYRTADRKLDIGYVDSCRTAGPEVMLAHK